MSYFQKFGERAEGSSDLDREVRYRKPVPER
ncbi:hypothetical protein ACVWXU_004944 [Streptomyces sp. TE33382]